MKSERCEPMASIGHNNKNKSYARQTQAREKRTANGRAKNERLFVENKSFVAE